jgi:hypothetical protein
VRRERRILAAGFAIVSREQFGLGRTVLIDTLPVSATGLGMVEALSGADISGRFAETRL